MQRRSLLSLFLLSALAIHASAADLLDTVKARGTLKIAVEGTYPPFNFKNEKGQLDGFDVEIAQALATKLNLKPEFITSEWSGILAGLQTGKFDIIVNQVSATDKRRETFDFTQPYTLSSAQLIVRKDEKRSFKGLADLKGKKLGVGQGSNYADLARAVEGVEVKTYPGAPEYLQDLALGRLDAALNDSLLIPYLVKQTKLPLKGGAAVGSVEGSAIPYLKGNPKFGAALDKALADIKADGSFKRISIKYFERDVSKPLGAK
ncbi:transporter substrate-binding domain-containing protein [Chitinimonas arctica]|uniref:Transporter substrate-binding domain-containing protein n=1 Tax=Chitinimonas arctica TaxID=2594795 RepID=A0A516SDR2_9NEIS|nr:transporter substrate-binding domain-containing protein [Chitinimonas arctica]QDQ26297.1 transporter substrate-binding domain-containing protein [Chitinimonas arctica]